MPRLCRAYGAWIIDRQTYAHARYSSFCRRSAEADLAFTKTKAGRMAVAKTKTLHLQNLQSRFRETDGSWHQALRGAAARSSQNNQAGTEHRKPCMHKERERLAPRLGANGQGLSIAFPKWELLWRFLQKNIANCSWKEVQFNSHIQMRTLV